MNMFRVEQFGSKKEMIHRLFCGAIVWDPTAVIGLDRADVIGRSCPKCWFCFATVLIA